MKTKSTLNIFNLWGLRKKDNSKSNGPELDEILNTIPGAASNSSSKAVSHTGPADEEMVLRLSDSQSLEGLPNSEGEGESSEERASASGSMNSAQ